MPLGEQLSSIDEKLQDRSCHKDYENSIQQVRLVATQTLCRRFVFTDLRDL